MNASKVIKYAVSLAVAGVLMYFSFRGVDWGAFVGGLKDCRWWFIALAMVASIAAFFFRSQRWRILLLPFDPDMEKLTTFNGVNIGYLANFVFPRIGEVVRCGFVSNRSRRQHHEDPENAVSFDRTLGTVLASRACDILVVFMLLALLLVCRWQKFGEFFAKQMWEPFESRFNFSFWWVVAVLAVGLAVALWAIWYFRDRSAVCMKVCGFVKGVLLGFESIARMKNFGGFIFYTVLLWSMYWLMSISVVWAMPQITGLNWVDAWFICLAGSVAWMVPVPGGFGAYHGIVALAMTSIYGLSWDTGILYATLNHEAQAITMVVCGIVSYVVEIMRK